MARGHPEWQWERRGWHLRDGLDSAERDEPGKRSCERTEMLGLAGRLRERPQRAGAAAAAGGTSPRPEPWGCSLHLCFSQTFSPPPGWRESKRMDSRCGQGCGDMNAPTPSHPGGDGKPGSHHARQLIKRLNTDSTRDPATPCPSDMRPRGAPQEGSPTPKHNLHTNVHSQGPKSGDHPSAHQLADGWTHCGPSRQWRKEILTQAATWMNSENIMLK